MTRGWSKRYHLSLRAPPGSFFIKSTAYKNSTVSRAHFMKLKFTQYVRWPYSIDSSVTISKVDSDVSRGILPARCGVDDGRSRT